MYTPEEINEIFAAYTDAMEKKIPISKELAQQMKDATLGVKNYTRQLKDSMSKLGTSIKTLGSDLAKGEKGASVYSDTLSSGADALSAYTAKFGPAGRALGLATKAITAFGTAALKQSDQLFESFQKVSRAGAVGAGGITELFDSMKKMGYVPAELERMGQLLADNSKYLALYSSSAIEGSKMFANVADTIQNSPLRAQLFNLGLSVDDINRGVAGYIKQEGALGKLRNTNQAELNMGTKAYLREMEILTRLTGQTREDMETQREQALQIDAFYAGLKELGPEAREQALQAFNQMSSISPKIAAEFAANFNGVITGTTDLLMSTGGAVMKYNKEFFREGGKSIDAMQGIADAAQPMVVVSDQLAKIGGQFGLTSREITMLTNKGLDPFREAYEKTADQVDAAASGFDRTTNAQAGMRDSQIKAGQSMAGFVNLGVLPATVAMQGLTKAVEYLTSFLPGGKPSGAQSANAAAQEKAKAGGAGFFGRQMAGAKAGIAHTFGIGGGAAATTGSAPGGGPPSISALDYIKFTGGTGSEEHFKKLQPNVQSAFLQMAQEYNNLTGKKLQINSAFRSPDEQANVNSGTNPKAAPGMSLHQLGRALDIQSEQVSELANIGLLSKFGFNRLAGDPPHISMANGGIASGPTSGYRATLHGTEAVVPLQDGRSIPVTNTSSPEQMGAMSAQLDKLDELISVMKNQLSVSSRILQMQS